MRPLENGNSTAGTASKISNSRQVNSHYAAALEGNLAPKQFSVRSSAKKDRRARGEKSTVVKVAPAEEAMQDDTPQPAPPLGKLAPQQRVATRNDGDGRRTDVVLTLRDGMWVENGNACCGLAWWRSCFCSDERFSKDPRVKGARKKDGAVVLIIARACCSYFPVICQHCWSCQVNTLPSTARAAAALNHSSTVHFYASCADLTNTCALPADGTL